MTIFGDHHSERISRDGYKINVVFKSKRKIPVDLFFLNNDGAPIEAHTKALTVKESTAIAANASTTVAKAGSAKAREKEVSSCA